MSRPVTDRPAEPGTEPTDAELMAAAREGCHRSFGQLVDRYKDPLVNYLTRLSGSHERAEDLAQEAFLRLYQAADRYDEQGRLKNYLYSIGGNLLRSEERRRQRWRNLLPFLAPPITSNGFDLETSDTETHGLQRVLQREAQHQLQSAVAELPLRFRIPLVLHDIEGWSQPRIAEHLGCRLGTVKSRIHRARKRLKARLEPYWNQGNDVRHDRKAPQREPATPA